MFGAGRIVNTDFGSENNASWIRSKLNAQEHCGSRGRFLVVCLVLSVIYKQKELWRLASVQQSSWQVIAVTFSLGKNKKNKQTNKGAIRNILERDIAGNFNDYKYN